MGYVRLGGCSQSGRWLCRDVLGLYSLGLVYWLFSHPFSLSIEVFLGRFFVCPSVVCPLKPSGFLCLCACVPPVFFVSVAGARRVLDPCLFGCSSSSPRLQRGTCRVLHRHAVSVTSLCVSGLESEAVKFDEAMKSKWFSQSIDSGVSILSAQLAALRLHIGGNLHQEWMSDVVIIPRSLVNSNWS